MSVKRACILSAFVFAFVALAPAQVQLGAVLLGINEVPPVPSAG